MKMTSITVQKELRQTSFTGYVSILCITLGLCLSTEVMGSDPNSAAMAPNKRETVTTDEQIRSLIDQIQMIDFGDDQNPEKENDAQNQNKTVSENSIKLFQVALTGGMPETNTTSKTNVLNDPNQSVPSATISLQDILYRQKHLENPAELAELFRKNKNYKAAIYCYQKVLEQVDQPRQKSWTLLQLANCYKVTDPEKAILVYTQLVSESPLSPWVSYAKAQIKTLQWQIAEKPYQWASE